MRVEHPSHPDKIIGRGHWRAHELPRTVTHLASRPSPVIAGPVKMTIPGFSSVQRWYQDFGVGQDEFLLLRLLVVGVGAGRRVRGRIRVGGVEHQQFQGHVRVLVLVARVHHHVHKAALYGFGLGQYVSHCRLGIVVAPEKRPVPVRGAGGAVRALGIGAGRRGRGRRFETHERAPRVVVIAHLV